MQIISRSKNDTLKIGRTIARYLRSGDILCLFGQLGAGKTMLTKGVALGLGIQANKVTSPSFILIRQYSQGRLPLFHFDLYRLKKSYDILALGYEEYLFDDAVSVIEWADRLGALLPQQFLKVELAFKSDTQRIIKFVASGDRYQELLKNIHEDIGD